MREPKFTDAWCFGKAFEANSKICHACLANKLCQKKFFKALGVTRPEAATVLSLSNVGGEPLRARVAVR
jgi:hypothetical protein